MRTWRRSGRPAAEDACDPGLIASAKTTCGAAVALVALVACGGRAQPSQSCLLRAGPEFRINTYTTDTQTSPVLASLKFPSPQSERATPIVADGGGGDDGRPGLVAVWTSNGQDGSGLGVYGQLYEQPLNTSGLVPVGAEFQVNVNTLFDQRRPSVAPLASGGFVVVYQSTVLVTPVSPRRVETIIARVFGPDGLPAGNEIAISQDASSQHVSPAVAGILDTTNGTSGFIVSWISYQVGITAGRNILVRVFGLDGVPITDETTVNSFSDSNFQSDITVASLPDGRNLVAWSAQADGVPSGAQPGSVSPLIVRGQLFDSAAHPEGPQFEISAASSILTNQHRPSIAGASDSSKGYVVAWQSKPVAPAGMPRKRSRLRAAPRLRAFSKRQTAPAPAPSAAPPQILAQRFDSKGVRISDRFQVNTFTGTDMGDAKAASRWDGGFVVVWDTLDADGDGYAVFGQAFGANGDREGPETAVNVQTSGSQSLPSVAVTGPELFVVAWSSELQDPDGTTGVYGRVMQFCPTGRDCQLSSWSEWTVCSVACGGGTQWRSRTVLEEGRAPGLTCDQAGPLIETQTCNTASCLPPADGVNCSTQWCYQDNCYVQLPGTYTRPELFAKCTALSTCNGGGATSPKSCVVEVNNPGEQAFLVQNVLPMFGSGYVWTSNLNGGPGNDGVCTIMGPTGALIIPGTGCLGVNFGLCEVPRPTLCPPLVDGQ